MTKISFAILFLIGLIVISEVMITGNVINSSEGFVNVSLESSIAINFTIDLIDFGSGSVYLNNSYATIDTRGNVQGGNWNPIDEGFLLENIGNTNVSIDLSFEKTAREYLGGTNPGYYFMFNNLEENSCLDSEMGYEEWVKVNNSEKIRICNDFQFIDLNDSLRIDLRLIIPSDSIMGQRTNSITATATRMG